MAESKMFCPKCGAALEPANKFCTSCGEKVTAPAETGIAPPRRSSPPPPPPTRRPSPPPSTKILPQTPPRHEAPPPLRNQPASPPQAQSVNTASAMIAVGGVGTLISNIIILTIVWAIGSGVGDVFSYGSAVGFDYALDSLSSGDMDAYGVDRFLSNAIAGAVSGALAGLLISIIFFGASAGGKWLVLFTILFWIGLDIVTVLFWEELGVHSFDDFIGLTMILGLIFGLIFSIKLSLQKSKLALVRVPLGAVVFAFAAVVGRMVQYELLRF